MSCATLTIWREDERRKALVALAASILLHLFIIGSVSFMLAVRKPISIPPPEEAPVELTLVAAPDSTPKPRPVLRADKRIAACGQASGGLGVRVGQRYPCRVTIACSRRRSRANTGGQGSTGSQLGEQGIHGRTCAAGVVACRSAAPGDRARTKGGGIQAKDDPTTEHSTRIAGTAEAKNYPSTEGGEGSSEGAAATSRKPLSLLDINRKPESLGFAATFPTRDELPSALRQLHSAVTRKCFPTLSAPAGTITSPSSWVCLMWAPLRSVSWFARTGRSSGCRYSATVQTRVLRLAQCGRSWKLTFLQFPRNLSLCSKAAVSKSNTHSPSCQTNGIVLCLDHRECPRLFHQRGAFSWASCWLSRLSRER